jgi:hypothetical protein
MEETLKKLNIKTIYTQKEVLDIVRDYGYGKVSFTTKDGKTTHAVIELSVKVKG